VNTMALVSGTHITVAVCLAFIPPSFMSSGDVAKRTYSSIGRTDIRNSVLMQRCAIV
jgi:hypothetical protein